MNRWIVLIPLVLIGLALAACAPSATPTPTPPPPTATPLPPTATPLPLTAVEPTQPPAEEKLFPAQRPSAMRGQEIYEANCATCHGVAGDGSGLAGAADFTDLDFMRAKKPADFFKAIRDGVEGTAMPAWGDTLSEMDMWDVLYYEWTFAISLEEVAQGEELFATNCAGCHGAAGDGSGLPGAADFTDQAFMSNKDSLAFFEAIRDGVEGTAMPAWGDQLSEDQIWALINFVRAFAYEYGEAEEAPPTETPVPPTATKVAEPTATEAPGPTATHTPEPTPTHTPAPTPTNTQEPTPAQPDPAKGQAIWSTKQCVACHGSNAEGDIGPKLAGTGLSFDAVLSQVRNPKGQMPSFTEEQVSEAELRHIYAWFQSLAPPTPTPVPAPAVTFDTAILEEIVRHATKVKEHSDHVKDAFWLSFEERRDFRARAAIDEAQTTIALADQAIAQIPDEGIQATLREMQDHLRAVIGHGEQAVQAGNLEALLPPAGRMVFEARLYIQPLSIQTLANSGVTGTVRGRVTDQAGNPMPGAFVTISRGRYRWAALTDGQGRFVAQGIPAFDDIEVKAYQEGYIYHEVHARLSRGATADVSIALPRQMDPSVVPVIANPSISGTGTVTFRMQASDPQNDLSDDQIFALNPNLGVAVSLVPAGGNLFERTYQMPSLPSGTYRWYFFAVDHKCNTSSILTVDYAVP